MEQGTIKVEGTGSVHVVPDVTRLEIKVESVFKSYDEAYAQARENTEWIGKILEYNGLNTKLAKTTRFDISDHQLNQYDEDDNYIGKIKEGFDLIQSFKIDLGINAILLNKIVRGVGKFIKGAQINIGYTIRDPRPHKLKMIDRAVRDAKEKASIMASAADCKLGSVFSISYEENSLHVYSQARNIHSNQEAIACKSDSLDITPDDLVLSDNVNVVWNLISNKD